LLDEDFDKVNNVSKEHICKGEVPAYAIFQEQHLCLVRHEQTVWNYQG